MLLTRPRTKLLLGPVVSTLLAAGTGSTAGCAAQDRQLAVGAADAAACTWLHATGGLAACAGTPEERLGALSDLQRAEVERIVARARQVDPAAADLALAGLAAGAAGLRALTEQLLAIAAKAPPAAPQAPAPPPPAPLPDKAPRE